jgi:acetoin utilization protein AcuB
MKVKELMSDPVITVDPDDSVDRVFFLMHIEKIPQLPVLENRNCIGIVSDRDLYKALGPKGKKNWVSASHKEGHVLRIIPRKVKHIMHRGVITIGPEDHVASAAAIMAGNRIGALPVVNKDRLVGIISSTDILQVFSTMFSDKK